MKVKTKRMIIIIAVIALMAIVSVVSIKIYSMINKEETVAETISHGIQDDDIHSPINDVIKEDVILKKETLADIILPAQELITAKYYYTNASDIENYKTLFDKKIPLTTDKQVFTYDGVIMAGIDLEEINFDDVTIDNENKKIHIILPHPRIISHEIDHSSFKFYDVKNSIFTSISPSEMIGATDRLKKIQEEKLNSNSEFWESVSANAETVIERFIKFSDEAKEYDVTFAVGDPHDPKYDAALKELEQYRAEYKELENKEAEYLEGFEKQKKNGNKDVMGMLSVQLGKIREEKADLEEKMQECQQTLDELEALSAPTS